MSALSSIQIILLITALSLLLAQISVKRKTAKHILFAIFCGSIAMSAAQKISGDALGAYGYLIGIGTCATCNVFWLLSRTLFREKEALSFHHIAFATALGVLMMLKQGYLFIDSFWQFSAITDQLTRGMLGELIVMLGSCVLILSVWEGISGFSQASKVQKKQRLLYLTTIISAIVVCKIILANPTISVEIAGVVVGCVSLCVVAMVQGLIIWTQNSQAANDTVKTNLDAQASSNRQVDDYERQLAAHITLSVEKQQKFLQPNLKVADIARELDVSEYLVSKVIKQQLGASNFNQYINALLVNYAQRLLQDPDKHRWPVLVVGLESGFASVGPFNRAFKQFTGLTPNQFRQEHFT